MESEKLSTVADEEAADALLAALSNIALVKPTKKIEKRFRSKFFYKPTTSLVQEVEQNKRISIPKDLEPINKDIEQRKDSYVNELPPLLSQNINNVREFWLKEVAPLTLAAQAGTEQAKDVVQRSLNSAVDPLPFARFQKMVDQALQLKMAKYISKYMGLPQSASSQLVDSVQPKKEVIFLSPEESRRAPKKEVKDEQQQQ